MKQVWQVPYGHFIQRPAKLYHHDEIVAVIDRSRFRRRRRLRQELSNFGSMTLLPPPNHSDPQSFALAVSEVRIGIETADLPFLFRILRVGRLDEILNRLPPTVF